MSSDNYNIQHTTHLIFLFMGLLLTVAFIFCNGSIYQSVWLGNPMFTPELSDFRYTIRTEGINMIMALFVTCIPWGVMLLYYYGINSVHFDRWWHWSLVLIAVILVVTWLCFRYVATQCDAIIPGLSSEYVTVNCSLAIWNALFSGLFFIIASFSARWWSNNCRHTPFPQ